MSTPLIIITESVGLGRIERYLTALNHVQKHPDVVTSLEEALVQSSSKYEALKLALDQATGDRVNAGEALAKAKAITPPARYV